MKANLFSHSSLLKNNSVIENSSSLMSQMGHVLAFQFKKSRSHFDNAMLIISVDVDVGSSELGLINGGRNDLNVHKFKSETYIGDVESRAIPYLTEIFDSLEVPATFAIRGQLTEITNPIMELFLHCSVKHDIGAHGYYHRNFQTMTIEEAKHEMDLISDGMKKFGYVPKSFVFPRNAVNYLNLLEDFGYKCYRADAGNFRKDDMFIEKQSKLYNIQPSLYLCRSVSPLFLKMILNIAIDKKAPFHIWFHPWNFGVKNEQIEKYIKNVFSPFLKYAKAMKKEGLLGFETMLSASEKAEALKNT
jgi:peptidoglycan/xylan/chitin deacetylase (PgdA/CDA1 family)